MATNIPPHQLGEVIDGVLALSHNPDITIAELMEYIPSRLSDGRFNFRKKWNSKSL